MTIPNLQLQSSPKSNHIVKTLKTGFGVTLDKGLGLAGGVHSSAVLVATHHRGLKPDGCQPD